MDDGMRVLLVDDDDATCDMFGIAAGNARGVELTIMHKAQDGIEFLKSNSVDIVVVDVMLPGMDGYQALDNIRRLKGGEGWPVVATTSFYTGDTQSELVSRGFDGFLPKPLRPSSIVAYLRETVGRKRRSV